LSQNEETQFAIRTISVYISLHGRYDLLSLLYARYSRGIGSLGLSPETSNHGFPNAREQPKAAAGIPHLQPMYLQPIFDRATNKGRQ
jgi:hypothetical protein